MNRLEKALLAQREEVEALRKREREGKEREVKMMEGNRVMERQRNELLRAAEEGQVRGERRRERRR